MSRLVDSEIVDGRLWLYFEDETDLSLPLPDCSFPVLVTDTREHVVYVQADSPDAALKRAARDTYDRVNSENCASAYMSTALPKDRWDWETVTDDSYIGYEGTPFDAHVEEHTRLLWQQEHEAKKAACAERGHVGNEYPWANGRVECRLCNVTLVEAPTPIVQPEAASPLSDRSIGGRVVDTNDRPQSAAVDNR